MHGQGGGVRSRLGLDSWRIWRNRGEWSPKCRHPTILVIWFNSVIWSNRHLVSSPCLPWAMFQKCRNYPIRPWQPSIPGEQGYTRPGATCWGMQRPTSHTATPAVLLREIREVCLPHFCRGGCKNHRDTQTPKQIWRRGYDHTKFIFRFRQRVLHYCHSFYLTYFPLILFLNDLYILPIAMSQLLLFFFLSRWAT